MPLTALSNTSSALENPFEISRSECISLSRSLLITSIASTQSFIFSTPWRACEILRLPSNKKGTVTTPTVRISLSFAIFATTGAAPVPVPPPIPAVMKTMLVLGLSSTPFISSSDSLAAALAFSGFAPAPRPLHVSGPSRILFSTATLSKACLSVFITTKSTPVMPLLAMCATALHPPPPTPITFIIEDSADGPSNFTIFSSSIIFYV